MIPFLTYPLALIALAAIPALATIYILRNRFRRRQVSSLMLWQVHSQTREGGSKVNRLRLPPVFFLELLILLLLVTAATGPQWQRQSSKPLIVVLDDSFSMRATDGTASPRTAALAHLERLIEQRRPPSVRFVLAGHEPRVLGAGVHTASDLRERLAHWNCLAPDAALSAALALASDLGQGQADILIVTDTPPEEGFVPGNNIEWRAFGTALANLAFVNAARVPYGDEDRCFLEIANHTLTDRNVRVLVQTGNETALRESRLPIAAGGRGRLAFTVPASAPALRVVLDADALVEDNEARLLPPVRRPVSVRVAVTNQPLHELISRTLDSTGMRAAEGENPHLVIHQGAGVPSGTNSWSLRWIESDEALPYTGPFMMDSAHPLVQGLGLQGTHWAAARGVDSGETLPVIMAGDIPLVAERQDALGRRHLVVNLTVNLSTLQNTPDWPIFFWNLLYWRAREMPGLPERNLRLGAGLELRTAGAPVEVSWPDGSIHSFAQTGESLTLEAPLPGIYNVTIDGAPDRFAVNVLSAGESNLLPARTGQWGSLVGPEERQRQYASVFWMFLLAALAGLAAHAWMVARGKGNQ